MDLIGVTYISMGGSHLQDNKQLIGGHTTEENVPPLSN